MFHQAYVGLRVLPAGTEGTEFSLPFWLCLHECFCFERLISLSFTGSRDVEETVGSCFAIDCPVSEPHVLDAETGSCSTGTLMAPGSESCFSANGTRWGMERVGWIEGTGQCGIREVIVCCESELTMIGTGAHCWG